MNAAPIHPFLLGSLLEPRSAWRSIMVGWPMTTVPALLLSALVASVLPMVPGPEFGRVSMDLFVRLVVIAPLLETLIMAAVLELLLLVRIPPALAIAMSSIGWGIAHSWIAISWGLVIWWPFLIFSTLYVTWRGQGRVQAIAIVFAVHALNNLGPALLLLRSA
jgi:hypothetical protein